MQFFSFVFMAGGILYTRINAEPARILQPCLAPVPGFATSAYLSAMEIIGIAGTIFACIVALLILWNIAQFLFSVFFSALNFTYEKIWFRFRKTAPQRVRDKYEPVLLQSFTYFRKLSEASKQKFLLRLHHYLKHKKFSGRNGLEITEDKKILVGAAAIQLTFGLDNYLMTRFSEIILYPDIYPSQSGRNHHKGETSMRGTIVFSWKHFYEGYAITDDKYNLGLHEMAHALEISGTIDDFDKYFNENFGKWSNVARSEYDNIQNERASILRKYAGANAHEFFAVCVEHFFEASEEFRTHLPEIYRWLSLTLRQDPLLTIESYALKLQSISNEMPVTDFPEEPVYKTKFYFGGQLVQSLILSIMWFTFFVFAIYIRSVPGALIPSLVYTAILATRTSFTYTVFEMHKNYLVLRRPLHFNRTYSVAYENITRVEFIFDDFDAVRIHYIDRGNIHSLVKYFSVRSEEIGEVRRRLAEKNVLVKE
jgi:MtfA peptidase